MHQTDELGLTALHVAAQLGHHGVATRLLEGGADPHLRAVAGEHKGKRALDLAQAGGQHALADLLAAAEQELR